MAGGVKGRPAHAICSALGPRNAALHERLDGLVVHALGPGALDPSGEASCQSGLGTRWRAIGPARHERAHTLATLYEAFVLELPVRLHHGVGVDRHLGDHLLHGRQLVADVEQAHPYRLLDLLDDLEVRGYARVGPQMKADRLPQHFSSHLEKGSNVASVCQGAPAYGPGRSA